ncbi:hypothetical protein LMG27952_02227 [Paraburkholderia hiiakae]|uniref:Uncharacterized protein n=1 Tax=Paraburkholderia hiiakae TaxID=1081782 RepID=A0ABM8NJJ4_9BURK|nr:hypothetical protein LMG27952_02227 [Paraburkholderia hiiakae]
MDGNSWAIDVKTKRNAPLGPDALPQSSKIDIYQSLRNLVPI